MIEYQRINMKKKEEETVNAPLEAPQDVHSKSQHDDKG
jgi:hypothetical protein